MGNRAPWVFCVGRRHLERTHLVSLSLPPHIGVQQASCLVEISLLLATFISREFWKFCLASCSIVKDELCPSLVFNIPQEAHILKPWSWINVKVCLKKQGLGVDTRVGP